MAIASRSAGLVRATAPAVPVGVADVDQRRQRGALADRLVEPHERVAQRQIVGVRPRRRLQRAGAPRRAARARDLGRAHSSSSRRSPAARPSPAARGRAGAPPRSARGAAPRGAILVAAGAQRALDRFDGGAGSASAMPARPPSVSAVSVSKPPRVVHPASISNPRCRATIEAWRPKRTIGGSKVNGEADRNRSRGLRRLRRVPQAGDP